MWLLQRAEPTPHDNEGDQRLMRTGILAHVLARRGHEVVWWTSTFDHYNRRHRFTTDSRVEATPGLEIYYLRGPGYRSNVSLARLLDNGLVARRFSSRSREEVRPDVIVASLPTAEMAAAAVRYGRRHHVPVVVDIRDLWPDVIYEHLPMLARPLARVLLHPAVRATSQACSGATAITGVTQAFVNWGMGHARRDQGPLDRPFAMGYLQRELAPQRLEAGRRFWDNLGVGNQAHRMVVAFFGTLGRMFEFGPVIDAARALQRRGCAVQFVICGDGQNADATKALARGASNVLFPGWLGEEQIRALLERADIGLAPYKASPNFINNIANKPAEYLSGGLPIALSLNSGPLFDLLRENDCGFSYHNNADSLAHQLRTLLEQPELRERKSLRARQTFLNLFDGDVVYNAMAEYLEMISQSSASPKADE